MGSIDSLCWVGCSTNSLDLADCQWNGFPFFVWLSIENEDNATSNRSLDRLIPLIWEGQVFQQRRQHSRHVVDLVTNFLLLCSLFYLEAFTFFLFTIFN